MLRGHSITYASWYLSSILICFSLHSGSFFVENFIFFIYFNLLLLKNIFEFYQADLRKSTFDYYLNGDASDTDLYQWYHGSKLCTTTLETLITLNENDIGQEYIEIKIRGPRLSSQYCFYFFHHVQSVIIGVSALSR